MRPERAQSRSLPGDLKPPDFSVVVCTRNRSNLLTRTIDSILAQSFSSFELLIVDDGSTDDTRQVAESIPDNRVRYIYRQHGGISAARNTGVDHARSRLVTFLDDDDHALDGWLEQFYAALLRKEAALACCGARLVDTDGKHLMTLLPKPLGEAYANYVGLFRSGTFAIHRKIYQEIGGFTEGLTCSHHTEFALRALPICRRKGWQVASIKTPLVEIVRRTSDLRPENSPEKLLNGVCRILDLHGERLADHPKMLVNYLAIAGVAAARLGDYRRARFFFFQASRTKPLAWRHHARTLVSLVPPIADRLWKARIFR